MPRITDDDKGTAVNLATWISLIIMCLVVLVKVFSKLFRIHETINIRNLQLDDYFISVALVAALGEAIAVSQQVPAGIGQNSSTLSDDQLNAFQKASYASQFLYIGAIGMAKFAALSFFLNVTTTPSHRLAVFGTMNVTGIWILVAWICIAAQCSLSAAKWDILSDKCFDQKVFWAGIEAINILIDLALVFLPLFVLFKLQTSWARKVAILIAFASRIMYGFWNESPNIGLTEFVDTLTHRVIPAIVVRLVYISRSFRPMVDRVYAEWLVAVTTQVAMNISIIVACVPFLKPLMDHLQPGWSTSNVRTGLGFNTIATRGGTTTSAHGGYGYTMGSVVKSSNHRVNIPRQQEQESHDSLKRGT